MTCPDCSFRFYTSTLNNSLPPSKLTATTFSGTTGESRSPEQYSHYTTSPPYPTASILTSNSQNDYAHTPETVSTDDGVQAHLEISPDKISKKYPELWSVADVVAWVTSFEALTKDEVVESLVKMNLDGKALIRSSPAELAKKLGLTFGPHRRLFVSQVELLLSSNKITQFSSSTRSETARAAAASIKRKKSRSPINRAGSFHSVASELSNAPSNDELSVASGLEDSTEYKIKQSSRAATRSMARKRQQEQEEAKLQENVEGR